MGTARITFLLALGASLWAAEAAVEPPRPESEASATVTVTAEATPVELVQTPNPVIVIDKAAIEASGASSLGDLLQDQLPGQVLASGGVGTAASIYLGGTRPQDTVVTLDGIRLDDPTGLGGVDANLISLAGIDRVEIQKGPASTRFGSDALGGAVALYSAGNPGSGFTGEVRAGAGDQGIRMGGLGAAYGTDRSWIRVAVSSRQEDQILDPNKPYRNVGTYLGLGRQVGDDSLITMNYFNSYSATPIPVAYVDYGTAPRPSSDYDPARQDSDRTQLVTGTLRTELSPVLSAEVTLGQMVQTRLEPDLGSSVGPVPYASSRNQLVGSLTWQPDPADSLRLGLDGSEESARTPDPSDLTETSMLTAQGRHLAVLLEGQKALLPSLRLVASLRTEQDRLTTPAAGGGDVDASNTQTTGKLGLNWTLPAGLRFYANAGTGFSNPLLYDALFNTQFQGEALNNEKSRTAQTGLTYAGGPWKASLELSRTLFSSLVYYDPSGGVPVAAWGGYDSGIYRNGSDIRIQSAELKGGYATEVWGLDGFYRNQEARDLDAPAGQQLSSAAVVRRPFQTLGLNGFRVLGAVRLSGRWSWTGPRYDAGLPEGMAFKEHFNDLSLAAAWAIRDDTTLTLRGEHLLQPRISVADWLSRSQDFTNDGSQIFGFPAQPPTVSLELRYRF